MASRLDERHDLRHHHKKMFQIVENQEEAEIVEVGVESRDERVVPSGRRTQGLGQRRATQEAQRLRALLSDVLGEQEAVAHRQSQLGTSLSFLQDQLEQMHTSWPATVAQLTTQPVDIGRPLMDHLDLRLGALQSQLEGWMNERRTRLNTVSSQENESWTYLMSRLWVAGD